MNLRTDLNVPLRRNVELARYSTMQAGGRARWFAEPAAEEELVWLVDFARRENIPFVILGKGSNVIFPDDEYPGLVITLIHFEQDRIEFDPEKPEVTAGAGIYLYRLVLACRDRGLAGLEFLCNVPGTVGGALVMNAGFSRFVGQRNEIGDLTEEVTVLDAEGKKETLIRSRGDRPVAPTLQFSYRHSNLDGKIVLAARFRLWKRNPEQIQNEIRANFEYRNLKQDLRYPSSGSIFKNPAPPFPSAGKLIEKAGLKGFAVGAAQVSSKHGNTIVNTGGAKSSEIRELVRHIQKMVLNATGVLLEPEVRFIEKS